MRATPYKNGKRQVAYMLPPDLIAQVKREAQRDDRWEAHVVEEILREHFSRKGDRGRKPKLATA